MPIWDVNNLEFLTTKIATKLIGENIFFTFSQILEYIYVVDIGTYMHADNQICMHACMQICRISNRYQIDRFTK